MKSRVNIVECVCCVIGLGASSVLGVPPTIHVTWDEVPPPTDPEHYHVDYSDAGFPDVELRYGSLTWRVWSTDPDNDNGIGDIGDITATGAYNYGLRIIQPDLETPGARDVRSIVMEPEAGYYSNIVAPKSGGGCSVKDDRRLANRFDASDARYVRWTMRPRYWWERVGDGLHPLGGMDVHREHR